MVTIYEKGSLFESLGKWGTSLGSAVFQSELEFPVC